MERPPWCSARVLTVPASHHNAISIVHAVVLRTVQRGARSRIGRDIALSACMLESTGLLAVSGQHIQYQFAHAVAVLLPIALKNATLPIGRSTVHTVRLGLREKKNATDAS